MRHPDRLGGPLRFRGPSGPPPGRTTGQCAEVRGRVRPDTFHDENRGRRVQKTDRFCTRRFLTDCYFTPTPLRASVGGVVWTREWYPSRLVRVDGDSECLVEWSQDEMQAVVAAMGSGFPHGLWLDSPEGFFRWLSQSSVVTVYGWRCHPSGGSCPSRVTAQRAPGPLLGVTEWRTYTGRLEVCRFLSRVLFGVTHCTKGRRSLTTRDLSFPTKI